MRVQRQKEIFDYLRVAQTATVKQLAEFFSVSEMTIRRDLASLEAEGVIVRETGGASLLDISIKEPSYKLRALRNVREKEIIAACAETLIKPRSIIYLDCGTTCLQFAKHLARYNNIVVTNWIPNVTELVGEGSKAEVFFAGCQIDDELLSTDARTILELEKYNFSQVFMGVGGLTENGITDFRMQSADIRHRIISKAKEVIILADHSKMGKTAPITISSLEAVSTIVTDNKDMVPSQIKKKINEYNIQLIDKTNKG